LQQKQFKIISSAAHQHGRHAAQQSKSQLFKVCEPDTLLLLRKEKNPKNSVFPARRGSPPPSIRSLASVWGGRGRSLGREAAATNQSRDQEEEKNYNVDAEEQARWNTECVCVCLNYHC